MSESHQHQSPLPDSLEIPLNGMIAICGLSTEQRAALITQLNTTELTDTGLLRLSSSIPPTKRACSISSTSAYLPLSQWRRVKLRLPRTKSPDDQQRRTIILQQLALTPCLNRYPHSLSLLEQQRVAVGLAALNHPDLLVIEHPLLCGDQLSSLYQLSLQLTLPIIVFCDYSAELLPYIQHVLLYKQGQLLANAPTHQVWNDERIRSVLTEAQRINLLKVSVAGQHSRYAMTALGFGEHILWATTRCPAVGARLHVSIASNAISLTLQSISQTSVHNILPVTVISRIEHIAEQVEVKLRCGEQILWAQISLWASEELSLTPGMRIYANINSQHIHAHSPALSH